MKDIPFWLACSILILSLLITPFMKVLEVKGNNPFLPIFNFFIDLGAIIIAILLLSGYSLICEYVNTKNKKVKFK